MRLNVVSEDDFEEHVHDLLLYDLTQGHILAVNAMKNSLEIVALTRVFTIKQFQETLDEVLRDVLDDDIVAQMGSKNELKQQLIDELKVRPGFLEVRLIFIWVHGRGFLVVFIRKGAE